MLEQTFKNIDDALWNDAGASSEPESAEQASREGLILSAEAAEEKLYEAVCVKRASQNKARTSGMPALEPGLRSAPLQKSSKDRSRPRNTCVTCAMPRPISRMTRGLKPEAAGVSS